ncbi:MAG: hypothetical protein MZW92_11100 [Comamonadaceae bacterium]|nr:hypothetical protein [Comamonadaceae bacterium]
MNHVSPAHPRYRCTHLRPRSRSAAGSAPTTRRSPVPDFRRPATAQWLPAMDFGNALAVSCASWVTTADGALLPLEALVGDPLDAPCRRGDRALSR